MLPVEGVTQLDVKPYHGNLVDPQLGEFREERQATQHGLALHATPRQVQNVEPGTVGQHCDRSQVLASNVHVRVERQRQDTSSHLVLVYLLLGSDWARRVLQVIKSRHYAALAASRSVKLLAHG